MHKAIKILFIYNGIFIFGGNLLGPLYAVYAGLIDKDLLAISISFSVYFTATTLFALILSRFGDRIKRKEYLLMAGYLVRSIGWIGYIFVGDVTSLLLLQAFLGLGEALGSPAFGAIFAEHLDKSKHITEYADLHIITNLSIALASVIGGAIVKEYGFNYLFIAMSALGFAAFIGAFMNRKYFLLKES